MESGGRNYLSNSSVSLNLCQIKKKFKKTLVIKIELILTEDLELGP